MSESSITPAEIRTLRLAPLWAFTLVSSNTDGRRDKREAATYAGELSEAALHRCDLTEVVLLTIQVDFENVWTAYVADSRNPITGLQEASRLMSQPERRKRVLAVVAAALDVKL